MWQKLHTPSSYFPPALSPLMIVCIGFGLYMWHKGAAAEKTCAHTVTSKRKKLWLDKGKTNNREWLKYSNNFIKKKKTINKQNTPIPLPLFSIAHLSTLCTFFFFRILTTLTGTNINGKTARDLEKNVDRTRRVRGRKRFEWSGAVWTSTWESTLKGWR